MSRFKSPPMPFIILCGALLIMHQALSADFQSYSPSNSYKIERIDGNPYVADNEPKNEPERITTEFQREQPHELVVESELPAVPIEGNKGISINFNNVSMIEFVRFVSRVSGKNFVFNEADLQFNVTIISEEPTSIENMTAALMQELRIRDLSLLEQGNNIIIHKNPRVRAPAKIVAEGIDASSAWESEIETRVFRLNTLDPVKAAEIIRPLLSLDALVDVLKDSNNLIITDLSSTVDKIALLIESLDSPIGGVTLGQYVVRNTFVESLVFLAEKILQPIAQGNPFVLVPHPVSNSIFIVSNPFIVEKAIAILQQLDVNEGTTKILTLEGLKMEKIPVISPNVPGGRYAPQIDEINEGHPIAPGGITNAPKWMQELPPGHIERTMFFIHKLRYRVGGEIEIALRRIADSLQAAGNSNQDLVAGIYSTQWIESSNALIFTGTPSVLEKIKELIDEIDVPLRQVFIEMLILDTTVADALQYGVDWGSRFGGGNTAGAENFISSANPTFRTALNNASNGIPSTASLPNPNPINIGTLPDVFQWGIIGRHLTMGGLHFDTIGALVTAIHNDTRANIILNPKIITEDNNTAEIFVGETDQYKTQSIVNDQGVILTNNFQFIDVGTTLRVTPLIGNNGLITLDIVQETTESPGIVQLPAGTNPNNTFLVPILSKNRTATRVHVPNGFFVVISGQIRDRNSTGTQRIPCLGGLPLIGALCKRQQNSDDKRNLMLFIRPLIVDTEEELDNLTKRQQDIQREKSKTPRSWNYEVNEALDFLNIKSFDPNESACTIK